MAEKQPYETLYDQACALHDRALARIRAIHSDRGRARFEEDWKYARLYLAADAKELEGILRKLEPIIPKDILSRPEVSSQIRSLVSFVSTYKPK